MPKPLLGTISGSRGSAVLGLNKWMSQDEVWMNIMEEREPGFCAKNGYEHIPFEGNAATRFGSAFESANIQLTEEKLGITVTGQERVFTGKHKDVELSCHVDGDNIYEGKTTTVHGFRANWGPEETNRIPRSPMIQVQHNQFLAERDHATVACLVFPEVPETLEKMGWEVTDTRNNDYELLLKTDKEVDFYDKYVDPLDWANTLSDMGFHHIYHIPRNDELIAKMLEKYAEFWELYVLPGRPPKPMNIDDIKRLCPAVSGTIVIESGEIDDDTPEDRKATLETGNRLVGWMEEYKEIGKEIGTGGNLAKRRKQLQTLFLDGCRSMGKVIDDDSTDKWIFRDSRGEKLGSWGKNKNGVWSFR